MDGATFSTERHKPSVLSHFIAENSPIAIVAALAMLVVMWFVLKNVIKVLFWLFVLGLSFALYLHFEKPSAPLVPVKAAHGHSS